ncbi:MAG: MotA/TolQ/ExbB proton channel family protein [Alphaproteobacteria bacterium]|nr:MotA/TolQ/ExbB proton channel family protein [Alphaproteobacteria bacterium]
MYRYLLIVRFVLINVVAAALLLGIYFQGWLAAVIGGDLIELSAIIAVVFVYGFLYCALRVGQTSGELDDVRSGEPEDQSPAGSYLEKVRYTHDRESLRSVLRMRLGRRIATVRHIANSLVFLGLIGTVIGFIIALSGVDPSRAADADNVADMVATLISGMSVALNTTLVGAVLYVWLIVNYRLLASGTVDLLTDTIDRGDG